MSNDTAQAKVEISLRTKERIAFNQIKAMHETQINKTSWKLFFKFWIHISYMLIMITAHTYFSVFFSNGIN